jgi:pyruvate/2-oxoglutarate dehydrogenase complex dihydrolipoamide acyltransferase (E2) component
MLRDGIIIKVANLRWEGGLTVSERAHNLQQQIQQQTIQSAQDFYGESLGRIKGQLQSDRAQLESLAEQMPSEEAQAQIQELVDAYEAIESSLDQSAQDLGVEDAVSQALQQAQETMGQVAGQAQEAAGQVTGQVAQGVQDTAGQAAGQAQEAVGGAAQQAQEAAGQATQQAQEAVGGGGQEEEPDATEAARQKADELGVDLSQVEGSGSGGRITIKDVQSAAKQG